MMLVALVALLLAAGNVVACILLVRARRLAVAHGAHGPTYDVRPASADDFVRPSVYENKNKGDATCTNH